MEITLKNLLTFLPMDRAVRSQIMAKIDGFSPDQTLALTKLCWSMFFKLVGDQAQFEFEKNLEEIRGGKTDLKTAMYKKIEDQIYKDYLERLRQGEELVALEDVRKKIAQELKQQIVPSGS